jgi:26S proteasome regulatory subunit N11
MKRLIEDSCESPNPILRVHAWTGTLSDGSACKMNMLTHHSVYSAIIEQAEAALPNETGGFLLGHTGFDPDCNSWYNWIDEAVGITTTEASPVHFNFTWKDVDHVRAHRESSGKSLIGWYHTHPGLGIFLSETDLQKTHQRLFNEVFQVALVYDPISGRAGYFFREPSGFIDAGAASWREFHLVKSVSAAAAAAGTETSTISSTLTTEQQS